MIFFNEKSSGLGGSSVKLPPFYFMWSKIKEFFSKFWWLFLVPIGLFVIHVIFRKETPELDKLIKEKKKEIKESSKKVEDAKIEVEDAKSVLEDSVEKAEKANERISSEAEERDKKAEEFFR